MRVIEFSGQYRRDLKREFRGIHGRTLEADLSSTLLALATDKPLDPKYRDHALTGDKKGVRDCHIKPDLVLLYRKPDTETLQLVRLGSHSELGL